MRQETSPATSKDDRSSQSTWSVEEWWTEKTKPSRQRNMTQSQRDQLAARLRRVRRHYSLERQSEFSKTSEVPMDSLKRTSSAARAT